MKHTRSISAMRPMQAQFVPILQFIGIIQAILGTPALIISNLTSLLNFLGYEDLAELKDAKGQSQTGT